MNYIPLFEVRGQYSNSDVIYLISPFGRRSKIAEISDQKSSPSSVWDRSSSSLLTVLGGAAPVFVPVVVPSLLLSSPFLLPSAIAILVRVRVDFFDVRLSS